MALSKSETLAHFDPTLPLQLAPLWGGRSCVSHHAIRRRETNHLCIEDTEQNNYAQIEPEALSILFGVKKFHQYLYSRKLTLDRPSTSNLHL